MNDSNNSHGNAENQNVKASHAKSVKPNLSSEPAEKRKPTQHSESIVSSKPSKLNEPASVSKPNNTSEPIIASKPTKDSEPLLHRKPNDVSEPLLVRTPEERSEPTDSRKPVCSSESIPSPSKESLRLHLGYTAYGSYQDHQKLRLAHMNRIRDLLRKINENIALNQVEDKKKEKKFDKKYKDENLSKLLEQLIQESKIAADELKHIQGLLGIATQERALEQKYKAIIAEAFSDYPIFIRLCLNEETKVKGLGPILTAGLISIFDVHKADHPSSFWKYAGYQVVNGKGVKRQKGIKFEGDFAFNPDARKLCFQVSDSFIKMKTPVYRGIYDRKKALEQARLKDTEKGWKRHADLRARRYMMKMFLLDFWKVWREIERLPLSEPYVIGILGHDKDQKIASGITKEE